MLTAAIPIPASKTVAGSGATGDAPQMAVALGSTSATKLVLPLDRLSVNTSASDAQGTGAGPTHVASASPSLNT